MRAASPPSYSTLIKYLAGQTATFCNNAQRRKGRDVAMLLHSRSDQNCPVTSPFPVLHIYMHYGEEIVGSDGWVFLRQKADVERCVA